MGYIDLVSGEELRDSFVEVPVATVYGDLLLSVNPESKDAVRLIKQRRPYSRTFMNKKIRIRKGDNFETDFFDEWIRLEDPVLLYDLIFGKPFTSRPEVDKGG